MAYIVTNSAGPSTSRETKPSLHTDEELMASGFQNGVLISEGDEEFISSHLQNGAQLSQNDEEFILLTLQNGTQSPQNDDEFGIQNSDHVHVDTHGASEVIHDGIEYMGSDLQILDAEQTVMTSPFLPGNHEYALPGCHGADVKYFNRLPTIPQEPQVFEEHILSGDLIPPIDDEMVISNVQSTIEIAEDDKSSVLASLTDRSLFPFADDLMTAELYEGDYIMKSKPKKKKHQGSRPKMAHKNFPCLNCSKLFGSQKALNSHIERSHKPLPTPMLEKDANSDQPFACPYCPKRFYLHMSLLIHQDHCGRLAAKLQKKQTGPSVVSYNPPQKKAVLKEKHLPAWSDKEQSMTSDSGEESDDSIPKKKRRGKGSKFVVKLKQKPGLRTVGQEEDEGAYTNTPADRQRALMKREKASDEETHAAVNGPVTEVKEEPLSGDSYSCPHCQRCFTFHASYQRHEAKCRAFVGKTLECDVCGLSFRSMKYLHEHRITHLEPATTFGCARCNKLFKSEKNLVAHERKCGDQRIKLESDSWDDDSSSSGSGSEESSSASEDSEDEYKCPKCFKVFHQKSHLKGHLHTHTTLKPFACDKCPEAFTNRKHLAIHIKTIHQPPLAFQCKKCPRSFASSYLLNYHVTCAHKTLREFKCEQCHRSFARKNHYAVHMREHSGIKSFQCEHCPRAFTQRLFLEYHMTTHLGIKPFLCKICHRSFSRKCHLVIHMKKH